MREYKEQQELNQIASCFHRHRVLGYITDSLGYITRNEIEQLAKQFYSDVVADRPRPILTILQETGLIRESEKLHYLRSFLGRLDQALAVTLRYVHGHDILMSHVALEYTQAEMEEKLDFTPVQNLHEVRSVTYWFAGEGPARPLMLDFFHLESQGLVNIQRNDGREVILPTHRMNGTADSLESIIRSPIISRRDILLVAGRFETKAVARN